jgi:hypothetical protein
MEETHDVQNSCQERKSGGMKGDVQLRILITDKFLGYFALW